MRTTTLIAVGPITSGIVNFGDLTILVGGHASGKGVLMQFVKLLIDKGQIRRTFEQYGYVWGNDTASVRIEALQRNTTAIFREQYQ
ncbi:hypothetical protein [Parapedobacter sp.]